MHTNKPEPLRSLLLLTCFLLLAANGIRAQDKDTTNILSAGHIDSLAKADTIYPYYYRANGWLLKSAWHDIKQTAAAPFHWQGREWKKFAVIAGTAGVLMLTVDRKIPAIANRNQRSDLQKVSKTVYGLGNRFPPFLLSGMYVTSLITKNRYLEHVSLKVAKSLAISTIFYIATKTLVKRNRPSETDNPFDFASPIGHHKYTSFPSGHANTVFSTATAFALQYKNHRWVPWVAYGLATLTCISRLYDNRHWSSDVLLGASLGHFVTRSVFKAEARRKMVNKRMVW